MDDKALRRLIDAIRGGSDLETASAFAGLSLSNVTEAIARGQLESERLQAGLPADTEREMDLMLWRETYMARAESIVRAMAQIQKAAQQGDWKAAAWWLERNMPDHYQPKRERPTMPVYEYQCANNHVVTVTRKIDEQQSFPVCGICNEPMERV